MKLNDKLYVNSRNAEDVILAKRMGFGIEIIDFMRYENYDRFDERKDELQGAYAGISKRSLHGPFIDLCPAVTDKLIYEATLKRYNMAFRHAEYFGAGTIVFHAGYTPSVFSKEDFIAKSVLFLSDYAADKPADINICIENVCEPGPEVIREIIDRLEDARFGACLDTGHANANSALPLKDWVRGLGRSLKHLHLHNNNGKMDEHKPLGDGTIDMNSFLDIIMADLPDSALVLECDAIASVGWLTDNGWIG